MSVSTATTKPKLYVHQERALQLIAQNERGVFAYTCSSGKSLIYKEAARSVQRTVILVPRKLLVDQFYEQYFDKDVDFDVVRVNSDQKDRNKEQKKYDHAFWTRFRQEGPLHRPMVALVNYQSLKRLNALRKSQSFDIVFNDESHNSFTTNPNQLKQQKSLGRKSFFFTATPTESLLSQPDVYGQVLSTYSFAEAVQDRIVKTFETHVECLKPTTLDDGETEETAAEHISLETTKQTLLYTIGQFILRQNLKRVIVYTNRVTEHRRHEKKKPSQDLSPEEDLDEDIREDATGLDAKISKVRASISMERFRAEAHFLPKAVKIEYISASTTLEQRYHMFNRFRNEEDNTVRMIVSCRTISEGIDLTSCDGVIMLDSRSNNITTTQRILRCTRLTQRERNSGTWSPAIVLIPMCCHSITSFRSDKVFIQWLQSFADGLECEFIEASTSGRLKSKKLQLSLNVGDDLNEIPYDQNERKDDVLRSKVREELFRQLPILGDADVFICEQAIFQFTCNQSKDNNPPYARNWDSPIFRKVYKQRARQVIHNLGIQQEWDASQFNSHFLIEFATFFNSAQMAPKKHRKEESLKRKALEENPNGTIDHFCKRRTQNYEKAARLGIDIAEVDAMNAKERNDAKIVQSTGFKCRFGCVKEAESHGDPDRGRRITYTQLQTRSADVIKMFYCFFKL